MRKKINLISVGDYIRTTKGEITKIVIVENHNGITYWGDNASFPNECINTLDEIETVATKKTDLIEKGDLIRVEGKIMHVKKKEDFEKVDAFLTKELFNKYSYKIEEWFDMKKVK